MRPGRKEKLTAADIEWLRDNWSAMSIMDLMFALKISKPTLYRYADLYDLGSRPDQRAYAIRTGEPSPVPSLWRCPECCGRCVEGPIHPCHGVAA